MLVVSGTDSLHVDRYRGGTITQLVKPFFGTFIGIVLDLDNPLPLAEIYEEAETQYAGYDNSSDATISRDKAISDRDSGRDVGANREDINELDVDHSEKVQTLDYASPVDSRSTVKRIELRHYGTELLTRDAGTAIRADIASWLAAGTNVVVSLDDVTDITPSLADEAFAKLAETMGFTSFESRVQIEGGTQLAQRLVRFVVKTRRRVST